MRKGGDVFNSLGLLSENQVLRNIKLLFRQCGGDRSYFDACERAHGTASGAQEFYLMHTVNWVEQPFATAHADIKLLLRSND